MRKRTEKPSSINKAKNRNEGHKVPHPFSERDNRTRLCTVKIKYKRIFMVVGRTLQCEKLLSDSTTFESSVANCTISEIFERTKPVDCDES